MKIDVYKDKQVKITIGDIEYTIRQDSEGGLEIQKFDTTSQSDTIIIKPKVTNVISVR